MTGTREGTVDAQDPAATPVVRIRCLADRRIYGFDVEWMKGAIFEFDSEDEARRWVAEQNLAVPGIFFLEDAPETDDGIDVQYNLKYRQSR